MEIDVWDRSAQLQFVIFNIFVYKYLNRYFIKKYIHQFRARENNNKILNNLICVES